MNRKRRKMEKYIVNRFMKDEDTVITNLVLKWWTSAEDDLTDPMVRTRYGNMASMGGILINICICVLEIIIGVISGSIAIISDAFHNLSDAGGSILALLSFKLAGRRADRDHPYGHGRIEYLFSAGFAIILIVLAIEIGRASYDKILEPTMEPVSIISIIAMFVAMSGKFILYGFQTAIGKKINSQMICATAIESLSDLWSMVAVTSGLLISYFFDIVIDGYLGVVVSLMIAKSGIMVLLKASNSILGNMPSDERLNEIESFVSSFDEVMGVHDLMVHDYGPGHEYASIHVEVDGRQDLVSLHNFLDGIERSAEEKLNLHLTIHVDPLIQDKRTLFIKEQVERIVRAYNSEYKVDDIRAIEGSKGINIVFEVGIPFTEKRTHSEIEDSICNLIQAVNTNYKPVVRVKHMYAVNN